MAAALASAVSAAIARGQLGEAARAVRRWQAEAPGAAAFLAGSQVALRMGHPLFALEQAERALALGGGDAARLEAASAQMALGRLDSARALAATVASHTGDPRILDRSAGLLVLLRDYAAALDAYGRAVKGEPKRARHYFNRGAVLRFLGRLSEAEGDYDSAVALDPADAEAWLNRSQLRRQTPARNHVAALEAQLATGGLGWMAEVQLRHALAKELEDLGEHERSFAALAAGAALRRRHLDYDPARDLETLEAIAAAFDRKWYARVQPGSAEDAPIFIVGLPRSGTTLVERILSAHPHVSSAGELTAFAEAMVAAASAGAGKPLPRMELIAAAARLDMDALGAAYLARARPWAEATPRFIDKLPLNFLYLAMIAAALPRATIVHVRRNPMANGYGMLKTLFNQGYPFSYDQRELGRYIAGYRRLMEHWRDVLGSRLVELDYEALVASPEPASRWLLAACGLGWSDACLAPHANPAPSTTQSAAQVREPIHARGLDQWRAYAEWLAPMREAILGAGVEASALA